ncbi:MAG TPA: decarboxylating 6-phosphogluconate dehydrogenase [Gaiella sp.]|jgi:6-phosphogluconate dehydrogenase
MTTGSPHELGMVGLGRMGANLARRAMRDGHRCVGYDVDPVAVRALEKEGAGGALTLDELVAGLESPRTVWVMVPAGEITERAVRELAGRLEPGDTLVDGGNTHYHDDIRRSEELADRGIHYLDVGTSGGVFGLERGFCLMVGGEREVFERLEPLFASLAPGVEAAARTRGREGDPAAEERGYLYCGPAGAGHFVKMVHNGIEYGLMAAYAEGLNVLAHADAGLRERAADAETAPLARPEHYRYELDVAAISEVWRRGSVVSSWLLDLTAAALHASPTLEGLAGHVSDSGEGRWTSIAAVEEGIPVPVLSAALYSRFSSRGEDDFANRVLSAMRREFGGHGEKPA